MTSANTIRYRLMERDTLIEHRLCRRPEELPAIDYPRHFIFDRTKFPFYVASCYQWLGDDDKAEMYAQQVLSECERKYLNHGII